MDKKLFNQIVYSDDAETFDEYKVRLYNQRKTYGLSWSDISNLLNDQYDVCTTSEMCRSDWRRHYRENEVHSIINDVNISDDVDMNILQQIQKEKIKLSELVTQQNAQIRLISREETLKEIALQVADKMSDKKILSVVQPEIPNVSTNRQGILLLSDWHLGLEFDNFINSFSIEIAKQRINKLLTEVLSYIHKQQITVLNVCILGDMISGNIHLPLRINSRIDVISQTILVSEILSEFIDALSKKCVVKVYSCTDNHSRLDSNKKDSLQIESFARLIPWYLKARLSDNDFVDIIDNEYGIDIISFNCFDFKVCGVHGHKDSPNKIIDNLTHITQNKLDLILTAHLHSFMVMEDDTVVVRNGSLMGTDDFAIDLRKRGTASQTIMTITPEDLLYDVKKITL